VSPPNRPIRPKSKTKADPKKAPKRKASRRSTGGRPRVESPTLRSGPTEPKDGATDESNETDSQGSDADEDIIEAAGEVVEETLPENDEPTPEVPPPPGPLARLDPMQQYLREVQRHALLTADEEHALAVKYVGTGDVASAARLVTANLRLVVKIAYEYRRAYKNIMDLVQEGNIGLMQAVKRYDPYRGVKLSSYAAWWIRAYILRFILNNWRLVKLGTTQAQRKLFFNLNKEKARLSAMGIEPSAAEIARRLGVEEQEVSDMDRRLSSGEMSLDAPVGDTDGRPVSRLDMMPTTTTGPDAAVADGEIQQMV
jgi:RNA polymerase sigma-32 factor